MDLKIELIVAKKKKMSQVVNSKVIGSETATFKCSLAGIPG